MLKTELFTLGSVCFLLVSVLLGMERFPAHPAHLNFLSSSEFPLDSHIANEKKSFQLSKILHIKG